MTKEGKKQRNIFVSEYQNFESFQDLVSTDISTMKNKSKQSNN